MSFWSVVFLGAIAVATTLMALIQIGAIVYLHRVALRVQRLADEVQLEIRPLLGRLTAMSDDAGRATSLAAAQVERADRLFADLTDRLDYTISVVQQAILIPAREGLALVDGLRAGFAVLKNLRQDPPPRSSNRGSDDDDALFIG